MQIVKVGSVFWATIQKPESLFGAYLGKFGPVAQNGPDDEENNFASLQARPAIAFSHFDEVMDLFKLPKVLGILKERRWKSPMAVMALMYASKEVYFLPAGMDLLDVSMKDAEELIQQKKSRCRYIV